MKGQTAMRNKLNMIQIIKNIEHVIDMLESIGLQIEDGDNGMGAALYETQTIAENTLLELIPSLSESDQEKFLKSLRDFIEKPSNENDIITFLKNWG